MPTTRLLATDRLKTTNFTLTETGASAAVYAVYGFRSDHQNISRAGFIGVIRERSVGWYLLGNGHRTFNSVLMRFHSPDQLSPFGKGGINAYAYCTGDPVNFHDRGGRVGTGVGPLIKSTLSVGVNAGKGMHTIATWSKKTALGKAIDGSLGVLGTLTSVAQWAVVFDDMLYQPSRDIGIAPPHGIVSHFPEYLGYASDAITVLNFLKVVHDASPAIGNYIRRGARGAGTGRDAERAGDASIPLTPGSYTVNTDSGPVSFTVAEQASLVRTNATSNRADNAVADDPTGLDIL
ncbi:RHS repeat-associated core domain-containing protein [Pseudomonas sp. GD03858]|uniref:RHS repeat-associated core domain-containing protein n=1 Tax=unclassified Pseudomonas TaxID=196821 RepID=UPI00244B2D0D|nr:MULTISPECIES: RHS repeat-associated core domain-containing protein [unclassified Pseudomonas]MDH0649151.1 RHS repeat-associated core domain-containing protein [Pseudomonas sp. GD03867]MDH0663808.1 RHS repeat-associated core domain-containing protein [Pseudomonas sp. GD03858]